MKIDFTSLFPNHSQPERVGDRGAGAHDRKVERIQTNAGESVCQSDRHEQVSKLEAELKKVPEVRQERVDALQRALRDGRYHPTKAQVADAVVAEQFAQHGPEKGAS